MSVTYIPVALRRLVFDRARSCCEYCLIPESVAFVSHQVDHVIAEKHGGLTEENNLAVACALCNKLKGTDLTSRDLQTGAITALCNPRQDNWREHFEIRDGESISLTPQAAVTIKLLQLNRRERVIERKLLLKNELLKPLT